MKKVLKLFSILLVLIISISNVHAVSVTQVGEDVVQEGEYSSVRFAAGNSVVQKAIIDGISFAAGNKVTLQGSVPYGFYAGNIISVSEQVSRDLFIAGNEITIEKEADLQRDVYIMGNKVIIKSNIGRDLRVGCSRIDLSDITIGGDAIIDADEIIVNENTVITGELSYYKEATVTGLNKANIGSIKERSLDDDMYKVSFKERVIDFIVSTVAGFITLIAILFIIPKSKEYLEKVELTVGKIAGTSGIGLVVLIVVPIAVILTFIVSILLPLSLITACLYFISIYLSFLFVSYIVGYVIMNKIFNKRNLPLAAIFGILVVKLLRLIPYVGSFVSLVCLLYGLGLIFNFIKKREA